jgi:multidrug efflux pump subunit AcrB
MERKHAFLSGLIETFLQGNLPVLLIMISLTAGVISLTVTPREEEPQIVVPLADIIVEYPGGSAEEVEQMVSSRLERYLYQIDGVEYVYSMSRPGMAVVTVRFFVGEDREESLIKLYNKLHQNLDRVTPGITGWVVKPIEIDDVPIVNVALFSERYGTHELYRVAEEVVGRLQHIPDSARITVHGGEKRVVYVYLSPEKLAAYGLSAMEVMDSVRISNAQLGSGEFEQGNEVIRVQAGAFLGGVQEVRNLLVGLHKGRPVYLRDVGEVVDGPEERKTYSRFAFGPAGDPQAESGGEMEIAGQAMAEGASDKDFQAVTIAVAKKKGSNAVWVADEIRKVMAQLKAGTVIPDGVYYRVTRNYGETANDKVNNLVGSLALAVVSVIGLISFAMSWREGLVIAIAVPITYSITLLFNYLAGYTINRVTLFALILALGLLVDDPIVSVDNITRHISMGRSPRLQAIIEAMNEIVGALLLTTLAIIVSFLPMFFITGMMGPYMQPMALNVPLAVTASTVVALCITPWVASKLVKAKKFKDESEKDVTNTRLYKHYRAVMSRLVASRGRAIGVLVVVVVLFGLSVLLALSGHVPLKMLPYDNKNEFQVLIDMPEGTPLETTDAVARDIEDYLRTIPEVTDFTTVVGDSTPMDFNGLVRHYYLRSGQEVGDIRVNLLHRDKRSEGSHELVLRIRNAIDNIATRHGANLKLIEVPPGPPVMATVVAEVYGKPYHSYDDVIAAAKLVEEQMKATEGVVDVDSSVEANQREFFFTLDRDKAGQNGVSTEDAAQALQVALSGMAAGTVHIPTEQNELSIVFRLPREQRSSRAMLEKLPLKGRYGNMVQLGELGSFEGTVVDKTIHHKNHQRLVYVMGEMAGRGPAYAVLDLQKHFEEHPLPNGIELDWRGEGEWKITLDVFRDLGIAFGVALLAIYVLLVYETGSYALPVIIMLSIPLTLIGIMPGFWLLNVVRSQMIGGYANPVFFTATAMIGMIALGGIVVRNGIILIDFIKSAVASGSTLFEAVYEAGAVRFRPIFLTAGTTMLGAWPITLDPIFSGLAWALIFGLFMSTAFTLVVIPVTYCLVYGGRPEKIPD